MQKQPSKAQNATHTKILPKKILIFASENGSNFEAIAKHFQQKAFKDKVNIELLTDNKTHTQLKGQKGSIYLIFTFRLRIYTIF